MAGLEPVGRCIRPNGTTYYPHTIGEYEDLAWLCAAREGAEHTIMVGPPGTGKSAVLEAAFQGTREDGEPRPFELGMETLVCGENTTASDFYGNWVENPETGTFEWVDGPLLRSIKRGVPLFVDEIFLADTKALTPLYAPMDGRKEVVVVENPRLPPIPVQPGWFCIAAGNPDVPGAMFSEALRDRFEHHITVTTDWALARKLGVPANFIAAAKTLDKHRQNGLITWSPQLRSALAYRDAAKKYGEVFAAEGLLSKAPDDAKDLTREVLMAYYPRLRELQFRGQYRG